MTLKGVVNVNSPHNLVLKRYLKFIFYFSFVFFLYFYFTYSFQHYLTKYLFLNCLLTGISFLIRNSRGYTEKL